MIYLQHKFTFSFYMCFVHIEHRVRELALWASCWIHLDSCSAQTQTVGVECVGKFSRKCACSGSRNSKQQEVVARRHTPSKENEVGTGSGEMRGQYQKLLTLQRRWVSAS